MTSAKGTLATTYIIGISVRTINQDKKAGTDIKNLWDRFFAEGIMDNIPNKVSTDLYNVYTNYQSDHLDWYDCILGCRVSTLDEIPDGMVGIMADGQFEIFTSRGELPKSVLDTWVHIWSSDLKRAYRTDFDLYQLDKMDPANAVVTTWVSVED